MADDRARRYADRVARAARAAAAATRTNNGKDAYKREKVPPIQMRSPPPARPETDLTQIWPRIIVGVTVFQLIESILGVTVFQLIQNHCWGVQYAIKVMLSKVVVCVCD